LTAAGRKIARKLTLRHHLIERMLAELFGMEWWKVHDEAERLEHAVSPDFEAKLLAKLGPRGCLPARQSQRDGKPEKPAAARTGTALRGRAREPLRVSSVYERDRHLLEFLNARGIRPGVKLDVVARNYDKTLSIRTSAGRVVPGPSAAERIWCPRLLHPLSRTRFFIYHS